MQRLIRFGFLLLLSVLTACTGTPVPVVNTPMAGMTALPLTTSNPTQIVSPTQTNIAVEASVTPSIVAASATAVNTEDSLTLTSVLTSTVVPSATVVPTEVATAECPTLPTGSFGSIWQNNAAIHAALGCPSSGHPRVVPEAWAVATSYQTFERGVMIWSDHVGWYEQKVIYVIYGGAYQRFDDTFDAAVDGASGGETPPAGLLEPSLGFGKVWRNQPGVREALGWATGAEVSGSGRFALFTGGEMVWVSQTATTYVFSGGGVTMVAGGFAE